MQDDYFLAQRKCIQKAIDDPKAYCIFIYDWKQGEGYHWCTIAIRSTGQDGPLETLFADGMRWAILWDGSSGPDTSIAHIHQKAVAPMNIVLFRSFLTKLHVGTLDTEVLHEVKNATSSREKTDRTFKSELKAIFDQIPNDITLEQLTTTKTEEIAGTREEYDHRLGHMVSIPIYGLHPFIQRLQTCIATLYTNTLYKELQKAWATWARRTHPGLSFEDEHAAEREIERQRKEREEREDAEFLAKLPRKCPICNEVMTTPISLPCGNLYQHAAVVLTRDTPQILCHKCTIDQLNSRKIQIPASAPPQYCSFQCPKCNGFLSYQTYEMLKRLTDPPAKRLFAYACAKYHGERWGNLFKKKYLSTTPISEGDADALIVNIRAAQNPANMRISFATIGDCTMPNIVLGNTAGVVYVIGANPMTGFINHEALTLLTQLSTAANTRVDALPPGLIDTIKRDITPSLLNDLFKKREDFYGAIDILSAPTLPHPHPTLTPTEKILFLLMRLYQCGEPQGFPNNSLKNLILHGNVYGRQEEEETPSAGLSSEEVHGLENYLSEHGRPDEYDEHRFNLDLPVWAADYRVRQEDLDGVYRTIREISEEKDTQRDTTLTTQAETLANIRAQLLSNPDQDTLDLYQAQLEEIISALDQPGYATNTRAQRIIEDAKRLLQEKFTKLTSLKLDPLASLIVLNLTTTIMFNDGTLPAQTRKGQLEVRSTDVTIAEVLPDIASVLGIPKEKISMLICPPTMPILKAKFGTEKLSSMTNIQTQPVMVRVPPLEPSDLRPQTSGPTTSLSSHVIPEKLTTLKTALQQLQAKLTALGRNLTRLKY